MSSFFYKYTVLRSFTKGKKTILYLSRFIFQLYRSLPILLRLAVVSFRFFNLLYRSCFYLLDFRFWLLIFCQFLQLYQIIVTLRLITEYCFTNQHRSNKIIKAIFYLSEPYFKIAQSFLPRGFIGSIIAIESIEIINNFIKKFCQILTTYYGYNEVDFKKVDFLLSAAFDEKFVFI